MEKETSQTTEAQLSPESRMALTSELDLLLNQLGPEERELQTALINLLSPQQGNILEQNTLRTLNLGDGALEASAGQAGLEPHSIAAIMDGLSGMEPQSLDALRGVAQQISGQVNTQVDPRFNFALNPTSKTTYGDGGAASAQMGIAAAGIAATIGIAI